ncbi:hypothetical protein [Celeribacter halophilus]|jgi:hypothetical protein|uniref:Uncharacterized protein n=1 Tax=Celeribacter halophilus TaxID=576117 RepID=A0AAW7XWX4_9RHOB|nr:hypothetical protein [Celeribacter halophilus]MBU2890026.1 hypothetical protein [Celeribacter halophilus]MDO6457758.1 hypothetical protein [Celeribacter halophilus]MDO6511361.1 hypothetical protein [Celeribacter halophilus]MDO6724016.1 hypothetical protein [Celeribacter halophilus]
MDEVTLVKTRLQAGIWEGELYVPASVTDLPEIEVTYLDQPVQGHSLTEDPERDGVWFFRFVVPSEMINDGVQTFLMTDRETGRVLNSLSMIAGEGLSEDIRAEMDLLRQELDLLKRAFRRHCAETGSH